MKRFEIQFEFDTKVNDVYGHFDGIRQIDVNEFTEVENIIDHVFKTVKKYNTYCITFRLYNSGVYGEGKAFGRLHNDYDNNNPCIGFVIWPEINIVETGKTAINKREIKRFVLDMIQRYKTEMEG